ncbi:MAG: hypothetical protein ACTSUE_00170 [Promethearchaeota archaeon]
MGDLGILKSAGVIEILLYLKDYPGGRRKVDIRKDLGLNPATAIKAHKILSEAGFLKGLQYDNATTYTLTEDAIIIANNLSEIKTRMKKMEGLENVKEKKYIVEVIDKSFDGT